MRRDDRHSWGLELTCVSALTQEGPQGFSGGALDVEAPGPLLFSHRKSLTRR